MRNKSTQERDLSFGLPHHFSPGRRLSWSFCWNDSVLGRLQCHVRRSWPHRKSVARLLRRLSYCQEINCMIPDVLAKQGEAGFGGRSGDYPRESITRTV